MNESLRSITMRGVRLRNSLSGQPQTPDAGELIGHVPIGCRMHNLVENYSRTLRTWMRITTSDCSRDTGQPDFRVGGIFATLPCPARAAGFLVPATSFIYTLRARAGHTFFSPLGKQQLDEARLTVGRR